MNGWRSVSPRNNTNEILNSPPTKRNDEVFLSAAGTSLLCNRLNPIARGFVIAEEPPQQQHPPRLTVTEQHQLNRCGEPIRAHPNDQSDLVYKRIFPFAHLPVSSL